MLMWAGIVHAHGVPAVNRLLTVQTALAFRYAYKQQTSGCTRVSKDFRIQRNPEVTPEQASRCSINIYICKSKNCLQTYGFGLGLVARCGGCLPTEQSQSPSLVSLSLASQQGSSPL